MNRSENINEISSALSKAQSCMFAAVKDSQNPFFKSNYADLESVWNACRFQLTSNNLAIIQRTLVIGDGLILETILSHSSGQWVSGVYPISPVKNDPQSVGSAISYARRYSLAAICGVVQTDDDGNAAQGTPQPRPQAPAPVKPVTPPAPVKTKKSLFDEIMKVAEQLNAVSELANLSQEWFKKEAKELTVKELETFLENMQAELGRSGKMQ